jgi:hypothetical protein
MLEANVGYALEYGSITWSIGVWSEYGRSMVGVWSEYRSITWSTGVSLEVLKYY